MSSAGSAAALAPQKDARRPRPASARNVRALSSASTSKADEGRAMTFTLPNTSHEFAQLSWFAREAAACTDTYMVKEAPGHRPVWGLEPNGQAHRLKVPELPEARIEASCTQKDNVVGLQEKPAVLETLTFRVTPLSSRAAPCIDLVERLWTIAGEAFRKAFSKAGIDVYYTRREYETVFWKYFGTLPHRPISSVILPKNLQADIMNDVRSFYDQERQYVTFGRPYKRVCCLYGPPGTGKTSVVTAVASELDRPLAIFNADSLRDDTFIDLLGDLPAGVILLFEDVDSLFRSERKAAGEGGMTFSSMLNSLDGVLSPRGTVIFLTTNHIDRLDEAILRPGRIDRLIEVPYAGPEQCAQLWNLTYPGHKVPRALLEIARVGKGVAPSKLSELLFNLRHSEKKSAEDAAVEVARALRPTSSSSRRTRVEKSTP